MPVTIDKILADALFHRHKGNDIVGTVVSEVVTETVTIPANYQMVLEDLLDVQDTLDVQGNLQVLTTPGRYPNIETVTASSDTLDTTNDIVLCDCTSNNITINLPTAVGINGTMFHIKKIDSSANTVTIDGNGSETIDGVTTVTIATQYESYKIASDGSNWVVI